MANQKLTDEELKTIKEVQEQNQALALELGNLELVKIQVRDRYDELVDFYSKLKDKEQELGKELSNKYGNGTINLEAGEFVPNEQ